MKTLFVCASVLTLVASSLPAHANPDFVNMNPYFAGSEEEQGKQEEGKQEEEKQEEQGKEEEQGKQEENKQEEQNQEEENQGEQGRKQRGSVGEESNDSIEAQRFGRFVCYARNVRGRTFTAQGFQRFNVQRRAIQNCRARSGFILGRTCNSVGCRRW